MTSGPCDLPFPDDLINALAQPRNVRVYEHWIEVNPEWWNIELGVRGLPGGPLRVTYNSAGRPGIGRRALFELAAMTHSPEGVLRLLWHILAWGGGTKARLMNKRLHSVASRPDKVASTLQAAAATAQTRPAEAYELLYPSGRTRIKYLGPAFFTKYLYFAGGGADTHPCAILDRIVSARLRLYGWAALRSTAWSAATYEQYCELLGCWARKASDRLSRPVAADEIERSLFNP